MYDSTWMGGGRVWLVGEDDIMNINEKIPYYDFKYVWSRSCVMWAKKCKDEVAWHFVEALLYEQEMEMYVQSWCK